MEVRIRERPRGGHLPGIGKEIDVKMRGPARRRGDLAPGGAEDPLHEFLRCRVIARVAEHHGRNECVERNRVQLATGGDPELAQSFNSWYGKGKIIDADIDATSYRLAVVQAARQTLVNGLSFLGIEVPEKM